MDKDEVRAKLEQNGISVTACERLPNETGYQLKGRGGQVVNVFDTGTIVAQGKDTQRVSEILNLKDVSQAQGIPHSPGTNVQKPKVFVVYGHDTSAKHELDAMLQRWGLEPIILDQLPSKGDTIIEKLEAYMGSNEVKFGVVLATPDDVGYPKDNETLKRPRARQNVVLELGMLLARLGRQRVAIFRPPKDLMEPPSDIDGLIYLDYSKGISEKKGELAKEIESVIDGFTITASKL